MRQIFSCGFKLASYKSAWAGPQLTWSPGAVMTGERTQVGPSCRMIFPLLLMCHHLTIPHVLLHYIHESLLFLQGLLLATSHLSILPLVYSTVSIEH